VSNLAYDDGEKFEVNINYTGGEEHKARLHPILKGEVSDHL
jgi:hypothetical protein